MVGGGKGKRCLAPKVTALTEDIRSSKLRETAVRLLFAVGPQWITAISGSSRHNREEFEGREAHSSGFQMGTATPCSRGGPMPSTDLIKPCAIESEPSPGWLYFWWAFLSWKEEKFWNCSAAKADVLLAFSEGRKHGTADLARIPIQLNIHGPDNQESNDVDETSENPTLYGRPGSGGLHPCSYIFPVQFSGLARSIRGLVIFTGIADWPVLAQRICFLVEGVQVI
ncbi:hypothetical protein DFH07DRAFT_772378 [Mycena maculata]|uniref:Uncharacterized protein n=1 Tax=Mycena maculata TaxID=230809 RepID=A0AAD7JAV1_9AGAR|nr:hypothetical protein DFH07DRAFT_772378 [Mycena maculata]